MPSTKRSTPDSSQSDDASSECADPNEHTSAPSPVAQRLEISTGPAFLFRGAPVARPDIRPVEPSPLIGRLATFMEQMRAANNALLASDVADAAKAMDVQLLECDSSAEDDDSAEGDSPVVDMRIGFGPVPELFESDSEEDLEIVHYQTREHSLGDDDLRKT